MALDTAKANVILRDFTAKFDNAVQAAKPFYPEVSLEVDSTGSDEKYGWIGNMPGTREWVGDRIFNELRSASYVLENKHWENSVLIKKTDLADGRTLMYPPVLQQLGIEAAYHPDELFFEALAAGESTACFDGQYFFDTDHVWGDSGSQDNDLTGAAATSTIPTAAELKAAFNSMREAMFNFKRDNGKFFHRPTVNGMGNLLLLIPTEYEAAAKEALVVTLGSGGATNVVLETPRILVSPHLTSAAKMYLFHTGDYMKPFVFQRREPLTRQMKGLTDLETKDVKFMTEARYNIGYLAWWNAVLYTFT